MRSAQSKVWIYAAPFVLILLGVILFSTCKDYAPSADSTNVDSATPEDSTP